METKPLRQHRQVAVADLHPHPLSEEIFGILDGPELRDLTEDIRQWGLREDPEVDDWETLRVIRGSQRLRSIREMEWETVEVVCRVEPWDEEDLQEYLIKDNLHRRHLTAEQQFKAGRKLREIYAQQAEKRRLANLKRGDESPNGTVDPLGRTRDKVAEDIGISGRQFERLEAVFESDNEEIKEKIRRGEIGISTAAQEISAQRKITEAEPMASDDERAASLIYFKWQQGVKTRVQQLERTRLWLNKNPPEGLDAYATDAYAFLYDMQLVPAAERLCEAATRIVDKGKG